MTEQAIADMEVLDTQEGKVVETPKPKRTKKVATVSEVVDPTPPEPEPPVVPAEPVRIDVPYFVMDKIVSEMEAGKPVEEAVLVDDRVAKIFEAHPFIIARESRNSYFYILKAGEPTRAACSYDGIWRQPVSYAIDAQ